MPRMPVLRAKGLEVTGGVEPVDPEVPDWETGAALAVEEALPVLPVVVDEDWVETSPLAPDRASGRAVRLAAPPAPPWASPTATLSPPTATPVPLAPVKMLVADPAGP